MADRGKLKPTWKYKKFLENETSFSDESKSIFYNYFKAYCQVWNIVWLLKAL